MAKDTLLLLIKLRGARDADEVTRAVEGLDLSVGIEITGVCDLVAERKGDNEELVKQVEPLLAVIGAFAGVKSVTHHIRRSYHDAQ